MPPRKLKPNQPCHCGSGRKYKKCCKVADDIGSSSVARGDVAGVPDGVADTDVLSRANENDSSSTNTGPPLRFKVGDRVLAKFSTLWLPGTVVGLRYRESDWPVGRVSPYQILLDDDENPIHVPIDGDNYIKRYDEDEDASIFMKRNAGNKGRKKKTKKKKKGKSQLREEARRAEDLEEWEKEKKASRALIPEDGNDETRRGEFDRSGMMGSQFLFEGVCDKDDSSGVSFSLKGMFQVAGWWELRIPENANKSLILSLLELMLRCVPRLRGKETRLDDGDVGMFLQPEIRGSLPAILQMCVAPEQFVFSGEGLEISDFVFDSVALLGALQSHPGTECWIDGPLAKQLCSICRICLSSQNIFSREIASEIIAPLFNEAEESAFLSIVDELQHPYPCRGFVASLAVRTMDRSWVQVETHLGTICCAISKILIDPRSCEETNGEMFVNIDTLLRNPEWVEYVLSASLDSLRHCQIHMKLDKSIVGGFDSLIKTASETIAAAKGYDDELFLLKEIFSTDTRGIQRCYCPRHPMVIPRFVCEAEQQKEAKGAASSMIKNVSTCIQRGQYEKALEVTAKAIELMETNPWHGGALLFDLHLRRTMHSLRGQAQLKLGRYKDALHSLQVVIGGDPVACEIPAYDPSKLQCGALLDGIRALVSLGKPLAAIKWSNCLQNMKISGSETAFTAQDLGKAQKEANALVSASFLPREPTDCVAALVDSKIACEGVSSQVRQCTWTSVGKLEKEDGSINTATHAVPRLNIVLMWVRGKLLIWNYQESNVIQWVLLPDHQVCHQALFHTSDSSSIFVLHNDGLPFIIVLDELHRLEEGGTCTAAHAMNATLGISDSRFSSLSSRLFTLKNKYGKISTFAAAKNEDMKGWTLAMVADTASLGILIFMGDETIVPDVALGPFAFLSEEYAFTKRAFMLKGGGDAHTGRIYELIFVDNGNANTLVSSSDDKSIKVWDLFSRSCMHTIRGFSNVVRTLACTSTMLFGAADRLIGNSRDMLKDEERENGTFGSHCINVWDIQSSRHLATLRSKSGKSVEALMAIPQGNIVLSGHATGEVHVWKYDQFQHIVGFKVMLSHFARGISFHLHQDYIVIMSMTHLLLLSDPTQADGDDTDETVLPRVGDYMNCGNCGLWKIYHSRRCPHCREVSFCDKKCLTEGWPMHKEQCQLELVD